MCSKTFYYTYQIFTLALSSVLGVHINMITANTAGTNFKLVLGSILPAGLLVAEEDQDKLYPLGERVSMMARETGYLHIQATKPDTIGRLRSTSGLSTSDFVALNTERSADQKNRWRYIFGISSFREVRHL